MPVTAKNAAPQTYREYFTQMLNDMKIKPRPANLRALAAVSLFEGTHAKYNPLAVVQDGHGGTPFNDVSPGVHVMNYPTLVDGAAAAAELFAGSHWPAVRQAMTKDRFRYGMMDAWSAAYTWAKVNFRTEFPHTRTLVARLDQQLPL